MSAPRVTRNTPPEVIARYVEAGAMTMLDVAAEIGTGPWSEKIWRAIRDLRHGSRTMAELLAAHDAAAAAVEEVERREREEGADPDAWGAAFEKLHVLQGAVLARPAATMDEFRAKLAIARSILKISSDDDDLEYADLRVVAQILSDLRIVPAADAPAVLAALADLLPPEAEP